MPKREHKLQISLYNKSKFKRIFDLSISLIALIVLLPVFIFILFINMLFSGLPIFFIQKRMGKNGKIFKIIKFRTMVIDAEKNRKLYTHLNESKGPVFKIKNDPRFTIFGKFLAKTGLDELPQLINICKGEMGMVGPRPLPVSEAIEVRHKYSFRELVKPGITSSWIVNGAHSLSFEQWMELDLDYVKNATFLSDMVILYKTVIIILTSLCNNK